MAPQPNQEYICVIEPVEKWIMVLLEIKQYTLWRWKKTNVFCVNLHPKTHRLCATMRGGQSGAALDCVCSKLAGCIGYKANRLETVIQSYTTDYMLKHSKLNLTSITAITLWSNRPCSLITLPLYHKIHFPI